VLSGELYEEERPTHRHRVPIDPDVGPIPFAKILEERMQNIIDLGGDQHKQTPDERSQSLAQARAAQPFRS
jgi:hypothetical protein